MAVARTVDDGWSGAGNSDAYGSTATAGSLTNWLRDLMGGPDFDTLKAEAAGVPLGAEGLPVLPYLAGNVRRCSIPKLGA